MDYSMNLFHNPELNRWEVDVSGEIDIFNSGEFKSRLMEIISQKEGDLHINFKKLDYLDSTALGALVAILKNVKCYGGEVRISGAKPNIARIFKITSLDKIFMLEE